MQEKNSQKILVVLRLPKGESRKNQWPAVKSRLEDVITRAWNNPVGRRPTLEHVEVAYMETELSAGERPRACLALDKIDPEIQDRVRENSVEILARHYSDLPVGVKARDETSGRLEPVE